MANVGPATLTYTGSTGAGQAVTALKFTDVVDIEFNFSNNTVRVTRAGAAGLVYYDYSVLTTFTVSISGGLTTITLS